MSKRSFGSLLFLVLVFAGALLVVQNAQSISDTFQYHQYKPSGNIAALAEQSGMNDKGKFLFYVSHPSLESAEMFNTHCGTLEKRAAILGCYNGVKIYIYDIADPRLEGIKPTTAAHEMLHAAYKRLDDGERRRVDQLLEAEYLKLKDDAELADRMAFYAETQPGDRANELHSIIGTEIRSIGSELEAYYKTYFLDRAKVLAQHEQYHSLFEQLKQRSKALTEQIDRLAGDIDRKKTAYENDVRQLESDIGAFNQRAQNGEFDNQAEFNRERQQLVARSISLDGSRAELNTAVSNYNLLVNELNSIAIETNALNKSIDSKVEPVPSIE